MVANPEEPRQKNLPAEVAQAVNVAEAVESVIGCKWSLQVLAGIRGGIHRPGELTRHCAGISTKVLNERLAKLTRFGVISRRAFAEIPPRVEYHLTKYGERFLEIIDAVSRLQVRMDESVDSSEGVNP